MAMPDIRTLVPHAGPMVLLDRVISADDENLCAEVRIRADSLFCVAGEVGAWAGLEYMAQAIGAYAGYAARKRGEPDQAWLFIGNEMLRMQPAGLHRRHAAARSCQAGVAKRKWFGFL